MDNDIKLTYFNLRVRGEPARLLLAFGGLNYTDERITPPWEDMENWLSKKTTLPWGQLPCLTWNSQTIFQSMAICRYIARELGISGRDNMEKAQVDEIIDVLQDAINSNYSSWFNANKDKRREEIEKWTKTVVPTTLSQLEKKLKERGGQYLVGNRISWADIHLFYFCSDEFMEPEIVEQYTNIANLINRVAVLPNIKNWIDTRPPKPEENEGFMIFFNNGFNLRKNLKFKCLVQFFSQYNASIAAFKTK